MIDAVGRSRCLARRKSFAPYVQPRHGRQIRVEFCFVENYLPGPMHGAASGGKRRNAVYNGQSEDTGKP
jgi:hypothetical protein